MPDLRSQPAPRTAPNRAIAAGTAYWAVVFAIGFMLGTVRTLWLAPRVGEEMAVLIEMPIIIAACMIAAWWLTARFAIVSVRAALAMGALAFALLMMAELALAVGVFGETPRGWLAGLFEPPGVWGLLGQIGFALFPAGVVLARRPDERMRKPASEAKRNA
ncbi:hypothetical protein NAP1_14533 [Erythrobacter sp. NAP1]|uniref:hypothetical protein n=1 Tax=Erythrobacter sp. NAP1 TaxID=237727 RepID=UPI000068780B|nr:hypothetical protein [Erythrobacter sp. NAP1]EAQ28824.1 hypothetical protein NAP1_14533 [Erythrobacter sp. NAP1]